MPHLETRHFKKPRFHVFTLKSWIKLICDKITYTYCVTNEFDQLLRFKTWETRLFKMPRLKTPRLVTGTRIAVASQLSVVEGNFDILQYGGMACPENLGPFLLVKLFQV